MDQKTGHRIVELLFALNREQGTTLILVTTIPNWLLIVIGCWNWTTAACARSQRNASTKVETMPKAVTTDSPLGADFPNWRNIGRMACGLCAAIGNPATAGTGRCPVDRRRQRRRRRFFTDRIQQAMERKASELLGADEVISAPNPIQALLADEARRRGLRIAETLSFRSVVLAGDLTQLAEVKAVGPAYRCAVSCKSATDRSIHPCAIDTIPDPGQVWLDERLLQVLESSGRRHGSSRQPRVPDWGGAGLRAGSGRRSVQHRAAPDDEFGRHSIDSTGTARQPGRIPPVAGRRAGGAGRVQHLGAIPAGDRRKLQGVRDARAELRTALERAQRFLSLAALVSVILAGVGVAIAARRFAARHWDSVAILRCVGATETLIVRVFPAGAAGLGAAGPAWRACWSDISLSTV